MSLEKEGNEKEEDRYRCFPAGEKRKGRGGEDILEDDPKTLKVLPTFL